jgi:hypothetical protein
MIFVLGGGFGLYGHLPALVGLGHSVTTLSRYRTVLLSRPELAGLDDKIVWVDEAAEGIAAAQLVCLARRPDDNSLEAERILASTATPPRIVLEKPIASNWAAAEILLRRFEPHPGLLSVPYLFLFTEWFMEVRQALSVGQSVHVEWRHAMSPVAADWKREPAQGGGTLAFYFIHCLAVMQAVAPSEVNYCKSTSVDGRETILATSDQISFVFSIADTADFVVSAGGQPIYRSQTPFGAASRRGEADMRLPVLQRFYSDLLASAPAPMAAGFHQGVVRRWRQMAMAIHA